MPLTFVDETIDDRNWSWRVGLEYQPEQSQLLYATISRGTKSGGFFSGISTTNLQLAPFAPEELTAYEVGYKRSFGNAYVNAAVFYYDYTDIQTFIAVDIGPFIIQRLGNVDEARVYGLDLEATWAPTAHLTLQGSVGWLDTELGAFRTLTGDVPKGKELPNAPDLTLGALARYEADFSADARRLDPGRRQLFRQRVQGCDQRPGDRRGQLRAGERTRCVVQRRALVGSGAVGQEPERRAVRRAGPEHRPRRRQSQLQRAANVRRVVHVSVVSRTLPAAVAQFFSWNVIGTRFHIAVATPSCVPGFMRQRRASRTADSSSFTIAARLLDAHVADAPVRQDLRPTASTVPSCPSRISETGYSGSVNGKRGSSAAARR